jgi:hypothetical protein
MADPNVPQPPPQPDGQVPGPSAWTAPAAPAAQPRTQPQPQPRTQGPLAVTLTLLAVLAGSAVAGLAAGLIWAAVAPRAVLEVVGHGSADVVNVETSAFIVAAGWFVLISLIGGIVTGLAGYLGAVRRHGPLAMATVLAGALAAALLARWLGQRDGRAAFYHHLAVGHTGLQLRAPLELGGVGALAFWPLAAGLVAGGIEMSRHFRDRRRSQAQAREALTPAAPSPGLGASWTPPLGDPRD